MTPPPIGDRLGPRVGERVGKFDSDFNAPPSTLPPGSERPGEPTADYGPAWRAWVTVVDTAVRAASAVSVLAAWVRVAV